MALAKKEGKNVLEGTMINWELCKYPAFDPVKDRTNKNQIIFMKIEKNILQFDIDRLFFSRRETWFGPFK